MTSRDLGRDVNSICESALHVCAKMTRASIGWLLTITPGLPV